MSGQLFGGARERPSLHRVASAVLAALLAVPIALVGLVVASGPAGAATAPDPPTAVTVTLGNTAALVAFTPGNNNGDPITRFDTACTGAINPEVDAHDIASPILVTGLVNGDTYTCTVTATNSFGTSAASAPSNSFVPAPVPDAPTAVSATRADSSARVTFTPGGNGGQDPITGYTATCSPVSAGTPGTGSNASSPVVAIGMTNGDPYTCTVVATNVDGSSFPSAVSNTITPAPAPGAADRCHRHGRQHGRARGVHAR